MRRIRLVVGVVAAAAIAAACTAFGARESPSATLEAGVVDATSAESASGDGAPPDVSPTVDASFCPSNAGFCDDFELGTLDRWKRTVGEVEVVTDAAARPGNSSGNGSNHVLRAFTNGAAPGARVDQFALGHVTIAYPATIAARAWVWVTHPPTGTSYFLSFFGTRAGQSDAFFIHSIIGDSSAKWGLLLNAADHYYEPFPSQSDVVVNSWACVEMVVFLTRGPARMQLFLNEELIKDVATVDTTSVDVDAGDSIELLAGLLTTGNDLPQEVLVDDVVAVVTPGEMIASTAPRIGCK